MVEPAWSDVAEVEFPSLSVHELVQAPECTLVSVKRTHPSFLAKSGDLFVDIDGHQTVILVRTIQVGDVRNRVAFFPFFEQLHEFAQLSYLVPDVGIDLVRIGDSVSASAHHASLFLVETLLMHAIRRIDHTFFPSMKDLKHQRIGSASCFTISVQMYFDGCHDDAETGGTVTDYSFRYSQRLFNNRIRVVVGGKISSAKNTSSGIESFIDNISLEYRLDDIGSRYVQLFHNKNYESILDGEITETGIGLLFHKRVDKFGELFIFRKKKEK